MSSMRLGSQAQPADPFASHLPVLKALGKALAVRTALEFGAGLYSTPAFLDRASFPHLEMLVSIECDEVWWDRMVELVGSDERVILPRPFPIYHDSLESFDLILIDDGSLLEDRAITIQEVAAARPSGVVVIHDFEHRLYQEAAEFEQRIVFAQAAPWTAVCWNGQRRELGWLNSSE